MGLTVSHGAFSGSYMNFHRFRQVVCRATGGRFCEEWSGPDHWRIGPDFYARAVSADPEHALEGLGAFFAHSDCEGEIDPETAGKLAAEMERLLPEIDAQGTAGALSADPIVWGTAARRWIDGCRKAHAAGEPLLFT